MMGSRIFSGYLLGVLLLPWSMALAADPPAFRQAELVRLVRHDCGSCHGMTLQGGLGPPLLPGNLADRDPGFLEDTIWFGRAEKAMPPWQGVLSRDEVQWIVQRLVRGEMP